MILAESNKYIIKNEYETAYLIDKEKNKTISAAADMYGDPTGAAIAEAESYCIVFGCGAVIYYIKKPFENYEHGCVSQQWFEVYTDGSVWFDKIKYLDRHKIVLLSEERLEYEIDMDSKNIVKGNAYL